MTSLRPENEVLSTRPQMVMLKPRELSEQERRERRERNENEPVLKTLVVNTEVVDWKRLDTDMKNSKVIGRLSSTEAHMWIYHLDLSLTEKEKQEIDGPLSVISLIKERNADNITIYDTIQAAHKIGYSEFAKLICAYFRYIL